MSINDSLLSSVRRSVSLADRTREKTKRQMRAVQNASRWISVSNAIRDKRLKFLKDYIQFDINEKITKIMDSMRDLHQATIAVSLDLVDRSTNTSHAANIFDKRVSGNVQKEGTLVLKQVGNADDLFRKWLRDVYDQAHNIHIMNDQKQKKDKVLYNSYVRLFRHAMYFIMTFEQPHHDTKYMQAYVRNFYIVARNIIYMIQLLQQRGYMSDEEIATAMKIKSFKKGPLKHIKDLINVFENDFMREVLSCMLYLSEKQAYKRNPQNIHTQLKKQIKNNRVFELLMKDLPKPPKTDLNNTK